MKNCNLVYFTIALFFILAVCSCGQQKKVSQPAFYTNPLLSGDYADPSILRVGEDYYMTHSSFEYYPGLLIWHSTDLINWQGIGHALTTNVGSVWAPDFIKHKDKFYIYFPAGGTNWVITAPNPVGPWSEPVDLELRGHIDPGHVVDEDGNRYLYMSGGYITKLSDNGLSTVGEMVENYSGWQYPEEWITECFCLESPKSTIKNSYYYMVVAEGGTAGPATSHMVVAARSKSPYGPFENSPYNPIVRTYNESERWWSQGHGTLVDDVDGNWWLVYHGYQKNFHTLGRQTLMLPIEWTEDDWFRVPEGLSSMDQLPLPAGEPYAKSIDFSDDFSGDDLGLQWQFFRHYKSERAYVSEGELVLKADGNSFAESSPLLVNPGNKKYEVTVKYSIDEGVRAGLCLYYNEIANVRVEVDTAYFTVLYQEKTKIRMKNLLGTAGHLRILNDENEVSFYFSADGEEWNRFDHSINVTEYNHNVLSGFLNLRTGVFVFGDGKVRFDDFKYTTLLVE